MRQEKVLIINKLGLHARAAARFVQLSSKFSCEINLEKNNKVVNGKSIMGVMMLAAGMGTEIIIHADGADENEAMQALVELVNTGFGELS